MSTTTLENNPLIILCKNCTQTWINIYLKPRETVNHVEGYVIVAAVFFIILLIGAPWRCRSQSIIVKYGVGAVFILSLPLLFYTLGLMQGQIKNELYPVWATFLAMLFGGTTAMSAQKLDENKKWLELILNNTLYMLYVGSITGDFRAVGKERYIRFGVLIVSSLLSINNVGRVTAAMLANKPSSSNGIKGLSDYMKHEHIFSTSYDPTTMQGYKYLVLIHSADTLPSGPRAFTLENIWCGNVGVLSSSSSPIRRLKDLCLSFALFHLVVRRYFGYTCPESKHDKTRALVLEGLLRTEENYERAFQVIEAELVFLHDFFFTRYASIMYRGEARYGAVTLAATFIGLAVGIWALTDLNKQMSFWDYGLVETRTQDVVVTLVALGVLATFQLLQIWFYCVSDWAKVSLVCKYITDPSLEGNTYIEKLLLFLGKPGRFRYWSNSIGQYSLLDSFSSGGWFEKYLPFVRIFQGGRKAGKSVQLPMEVKIAVAQTIKRSNGQLSHGSSALMKHGMGDRLGWACHIDDEFNLTHSLLVWHVATSYCEISELSRHPGEDVHVAHPILNKIVATSLSKYCAYLVAFAPVLLPGSPIETESTLDDLLGRAKYMFQKFAVTVDKHQNLRELHIEGTPEILAKGAILGEELERMGHRATRWNLLADFWAEMLVYIAPSHNVAAHIECLAQGGEFLTHVWALLMHAGILERPAAGAS